MNKPHPPQELLGYCEKCKKPVRLGEETWGYFLPPNWKRESVWVLSHDGYLHCKECGR